MVVEDLYLLLTKDMKIVGYNEKQMQNPLDKIVVFYAGEFDFSMGENIEGKNKEFYLNEDGTIRIEYVDIELQEEPLSEQEQIAIDTALTVEYMACLLEASLT